MKMYKFLIVILSLFLMGISGAGVDFNSTSKFFGERSGWRKSTIELSDVQAMYGGMTVKINGDGTTTMSIYKPANQNGYRFKVEDYRFQINTLDFDDMVQRFIDNDFLSIEIQNRAGIPDETKVIISVTNASGQKFSISKWHDIRNKWFDRLYDSLSMLQNQTENYKPISSRLEK